MVFKSPFASVPVSTETFHEKLLRAIWHHGTAHPTKPALVAADDATKYVTFHEMYTQVHSVRAFLRVRGFKSGDVACLVLSNCIEWPIFQLGAQAAGGAISGASALFTDFELERQFLDSRCSVVFTDEPHLKKVMHAAANCDKVKTIICLRNGTSHSAHLPGHIIEWSEVVSFRPEYDVAKVNVESMAVLPYSSGTTGSPKGVMLSHRNFGTMIEIVKDHFDRELVPHMGSNNHNWYNESFLLNLPFYHIFGFGMMSTALLIGVTGVVIDKFEPKLFLSVIEKYRPRLLFTVPPILIFLAKHPMVADFDVSSIEFVLSGAAPAGKDICEEFLSRHKTIRYLTQGYGMTECGMASHLPDLNVKDVHIGVGKVAANFEQKIIDVGTGKEVANGERGELCVRCATVMMGYLNRPEATAETVDKEGWLHTGDIAYMEDDGRTFIVDRLKELIKVKGLQVPPAELEDLLLSHPLVRDAAVIGLPDKRRGELVRAYVVRANETLSEDDVIKFVAHKVSEYKHITGGVKFVTEVPKSAAGKILRRQLREEAAKENKSKL
ncbi:hypothetical protein PFISCL1PPCAC_8179 [Pristionchus fissidentatus]|uniref:AMP-binding protein n=1 Tax=Pristionchus fissidentatus TaxID=1538716 RepID=A0AAV5VB44_9BILA|nr:hypothetical protein PFISCL1PPCAC_8179 [Pristionchus fissidentatus]